MGPCQVFHIPSKITYVDGKANKKQRSTGREAQQEECVVPFFGNTNITYYTEV